MGAQLNIKNAEALALATQLAEAEGLTKTQIIVEALRARAEQNEMLRKQKVTKLMGMARDIRSRMSPEALAFDIDKELYEGETGLPK